MVVDHPTIADADRRAVRTARGGGHLPQEVDAVSQPIDTTHDRQEARRRRAWQRTPWPTEHRVVIGRILTHGRELSA